MDTWTNPVVLVAIITATGVISGQIVAWAGKRKELSLESMQAAISVLTAENERINTELAAMRAEMTAMQKDGRLSTEKYSVCLTHVATLRLAAGSLFLRIRTEAPSLVHADLPPIPALIRDDLLHDWPELAAP